MLASLSAQWLLTSGMHTRCASAQVLADIRPNEEHAANHILRNPTRTGVQAVPSRSEHDVSILISPTSFEDGDDGCPHARDPH